MVYVLNKEGRPLMPTDNHGYVRKLLKKGKAKAVCHRPFTIQLTYETKDEVEPVILGIDPGRMNIGLCAVTESGKPLFAAEVKIRNKDIPKLMAKRKAFRMAHRQNRRRRKRQRRALANGTTLKEGSMERHLPLYGKDKVVTCKVIRNREARFSNRRRPDKWLTPTANQLLQTHVNAVRLVSRFLPVNETVLELNKFTFMRMDDPSVSGRMFQQGMLFGYEGSVKSAVRHVQEGKCLLCGAPIEEYHHVRERHKDGSETVRNRVGLCSGCHRLVHTDEGTKQALAKKAKGLRKRYGALGVLNQIVPFLMESLSERYGLSVTAGWQTKEFREIFDLPKEHYMDAYVIACSGLRGFDVQAPGGCYHIRQFRRHDRKACERAMYNRSYMLNGKVVAQNRHRAFEQKLDSLEEYVKNGGRTDNLKVRHIREAMKDMARYYPGCQVIQDGRVRTLLKRAEGSYWFDDGMKSTVRKTQITLNNKGLVFVSNTIA